MAVLLVAPDLAHGCSVSNRMMIDVSDAVEPDGSGLEKIETLVFETEEAL